MDMGQPSYGSFGLIALATILFSLVLRRALGGKDTGAKLKLPPGPWNLPVIGSLHHFASTKLAHRDFLRLSLRHGPLMLLKLGEVPTVIASTAEAAMAVLRTNDLALADRPGGPTLDIVSSGGKGLIFAPHGEHWRQMRKVCVVELLSARQVRRMDSIKQEEVAFLVESVSAAAASSSVVNLGQAMAKLTSNLIARAAFGGKCPQQEAYLRELNAMVELMGGLSAVDLFPSSRLVRCLSGSARGIRRSHARMQTILGDIIEERKEKKPSRASAARDDEDLLDVLLRLQKEDTIGFPLTSEIIAAVIFDIFGAATDTTAAMLEWTMAELVRNPHVMARAKLEVRQSVGQGRSTVTSADLGQLHYLRMVIKETLRLHPAGAMVFRASRQNCQVMGYDIPKGVQVFVSAFAVGRDPAHWGEDAAEFRPERFEETGATTVEYTPGTHMEFVPFGAGRRQCPGALFATTTMELVLANLLYHFDWAVPGGAAPETLDMSEVLGAILHAKSSLCLEARRPQKP